MPTPAEIILSKIPLPTSLDSAGIRERWAADIRRRALFSARMASESYLKDLRRVLVAYAEGNINAAEARERLRFKLQALGLDGGTHALTDPGSLRRLNLILQTQRKMAASVARLQARDPDELEDWPAWRLERYGSRHVPRDDRSARWQAAGQSVGWQGAHRRQLVALKTSPIWQALGDGAGGFKDTLGNPYPPFAYGSGMDWTDVDAEEAKRLGLEPDGSLPHVTLSPSDQEVARSVGRSGVLDRLTIANSRAPFHKCPKCSRFASFDGTCDHCDATLPKDKMVQRGREALAKATTGKPKDVPRAMHKPGLGTIHFLLGWEGKGEVQEHGKGLAKILQKHRKEMERLPETIAKGKVYPLKNRDTGKDDPNRKAIVYGSYLAFLSRHQNGWAVTSHYQAEETARAIRASRQKIEHPHSEVP